MNDREEQLLEAFENVLRIKNECSCTIFTECGLAELTVKQVAYLKTIDAEGEITFTRLAEITRNSKPTITEMINRFVRMECVYRERCPEDGRLQYIRLTEKGKMIAQAEHMALRRAIGRMMDTLDEHEMDLLIGVLQKVR